MKLRLSELRALVREAVKGGVRNKRTGRYSYSTDMDRTCACGHTLGVHAGEPPHPCFNDDEHLEGATGEPCECPGFEPLKALK